MTLRDTELEAAIQERFTVVPNGESVVLADLTTFDWDTVGVFPPGTTAEKVAETLAVDEAPAAAEFSRAPRLVFVANGETVAYADVSSPNLYADALTYSATAELLQVGDPNGSPGARLTAPETE